MDATLILADAYLHRIDPFVFHVSDSWGPRWYGLSYVAGFIVGYLLLRWMARRRAILLPAAAVMDFIFYGALGLVIGGRLGYVIFYEPGYLVTFTDAAPYWKVLAVHEGGMASHGGIIGLLVACVIFARRRHVNLLHLLDICAFGSGLGIMFGRIANFINGEMYGRHTSADLPWAVRFPHEIVAWNRASRLDDLAPAVDALALPQFNGQQWQGLVDPPVTAENWRLIQSIKFRLIEATQQDTAVGQTVASALRPVLEPRHPSQLYAALSEGLFMFVLMFVLWARPRKPGVIGSVFLIVYGMIRVLGEQFRTIDYYWLGITRVQWLSAAMVVIGAVWLAWAVRRNVPRIGGWRAVSGQ